MVRFDIHQHVALGTNECDLFQVPERAQFDRWLGTAEFVAPPSAAGTMRVLLPPCYYKLTQGMEDVRRLNDLMHQVQQSRRTDTPAVFGVIEPHHGHAAFAEIDRIGRELKLAGLAWCHRAHGVFADMPLMARFVERAAKHGLLPMLHVTPLSGNESLWRVWNLAEQLPDIPMVALGALSTWDQVQAVLANPYRARNLCYDTAEIFGGTDHIAELAERLGSERLLFGSGAHTAGDAPASVNSHWVISESPLATSVKSRILRDNALRLLKLD